MPLPPNFSIVTLGVADLDRSIDFYLALGWELRGDRAQGIVWFRTTGTWIGLFPTEDLAGDVGLPAEPLPEFRGSTLALNFDSPQEVDAAFEVALAAGARLVKKATMADWGGYSGYVADPDGHLWELAHAPGFTVEDGRLHIP